VICSISQVETFDQRQVGGCERRYWFERVQGLRPEQTSQQTDGEAGHALLATYFSTGVPPKGRVRMGKMVTGAIVKGDLPAPGPEMLVESRFSGQPRLDAGGNWIPPDPAKTLWLGGVPWDGFVDLRFRRGDVPEIWDHKFTSDILAFAKSGAQLIHTVQMPVYVLDSLRIWPDATRWKLVHHYVERSGVNSSIRAAEVGTEQVLERKADVEQLVSRMLATADIELQSDVPYNKKSCGAWGGCPHQSICSAYKEKRVSLSAEEMALFDDLVPAEVVPPDAPPNDASLSPPEKAQLAFPTLSTEVAFYEPVPAPAPTPTAAAEAPKAEPIVVQFEIGPNALALLRLLIK
jgi:hypothetical protein